jgi:hypothetical protein
MLALPLTSCVTLGKLLNLSVPEKPHLQSGAVRALILLSGQGAKTYVWSYGHAQAPAA